MRIIGPILVLVAIAGGASGCHDELVFAECIEDDSECLDEREIRRCRNGHWETESCLELCTRDPLSGFLGCLRLVDRPDECACSGPYGCTSDKIGVCASSYATYVCTESRIVAVSCGDVCRTDSPDTPLPTGCAYDEELGTERCLCTKEGASCTAPVWEQCLDEHTLFSCDNGVWTSHSCDELCGTTQNGGCTVDLDRNLASCRCS